MTSAKKIRRTLAYVLRLVQNDRKKNVNTGPITVQELKESENQLFRWSQIHLKPSVIAKKLIPSLDENAIIRAHDSKMSYCCHKKWQTLLFYHATIHLFSCYYVIYTKSVDIVATKSLIHEARRIYWIIGVSNISKALTAKCVTCRKPRKRPLDQLMGQIPSLRVAAGFPPFSNTAIDMCGPLHIKVNRKTVKEVEVVIFACMTTRAVQLELVNDKTADAFLMAFRRFESLRGHPRVCWSDCGTNFVGTHTCLKKTFIIETTNTFIHYSSSLVNHTRFQTKMGKIYICSQAKTAP